MNKLMLTEEEKEVIHYWLEAGKEKFYKKYGSKETELILTDLDNVRKKMLNNYEFIEITVKEAISTAMFIHVIAARLNELPRSEGDMHFSEVLRTIDSKLYSIVQSELKG